MLRPSAVRPHPRSDAFRSAKQRPFAERKATLAQSMCISLLVMVLLGGFLPMANLLADDPAPDGATAVAAPSQNTDPAKAESAPPAANESGSSDPAALFQAKSQAWRDVIKQLRNLKLQFETAGPAEAEQIREKWESLIAEGRSLIGQLRDAGMLAYRAAPDQDYELTKFLVKMVYDDVEHDKYQSALELAELLLEHKSDFKVLYNLAGIAAWCLNDFPKAESYLTTAGEQRVLAGVTNHDLKKVAGYLVGIEQMKQLWQKEQEVRAAEAKADDLPRVKLTTTKGEIVIELFENEAPQTVGNFVSLVEKGFYNGLTFQRVVSGFMAQGGDPSGDGTGGPGYQIFCECYQDAHRNHFGGSLSMAHMGRDTGGSQFFITYAPAPQLNGKHTVFGRVVSGMETVAGFNRGEPVTDPDKILTAEVLRKRPHEYKPTKVKQ